MARTKLKSQLTRWNRPKPFTDEVVERELRETVLRLIRDATDAARGSSIRMGKNMTTITWTLTALSVHFAKMGGVTEDKMHDIVRELWAHNQLPR